MTDVVLQVYNRIGCKIEYLLLTDSETINLGSITLLGFLLVRHEKDKLEFMIKSILNKHYDCLIRGVITFRGKNPLDEDEKQMLELYNQDTVIDEVH